MKTDLQHYFLAIGRFMISVSTNCKLTQDTIALHYLHLRKNSADFIDFEINIMHASGGLQAVIDEDLVFNAIPLKHAPLALEWSINHCIYQNLHHFLILHAATVVKDDKAVILPAVSGTGKSTLSAALMLSGWRLLSDELTIMHGFPPKVMHLPKPVNLKNDSIDLINKDFPQAVFGDWIPETEKGDIKLLQLHKLADTAYGQSYEPSLIVTLARQQGQAPELYDLGPTDTFQALINNSVNYTIQGEKGFDAFCWMVDNCQALHLSYNELLPAVEQLDKVLVDG